MDLFSEAARRDPYPIYARLRARTPVVYEPDADLWLVLGYDAVERVLADHAAFSADSAPARGGAFEWLLFMDPPRHTQLRSLVQRAFTPRSIAALEPAIRAISRQLLDAIATDEVELVEAYATPLPQRVITAMLGVPATEGHTLARWSDAIVGLGNTIAGGDAAAAAHAFARADAEMHAWFGAELAARRVAPRDDLLTRLVHAEVDGAQLDAGAVVRFCQLLLVAGTETTTNLITNALICFAAHPGELARVRAEPSLLRWALEEVLRYRSPVQAMFRVARHAVELDGVQVPAGAFVVPVIGAANRDPRAFAEPDRFDVAREPNAHLAFGHGVHDCLGAALARLEARIAVADLLARFRRFELVEPAWPPRGSFHVHGPARLRLRVER